MHKDYLLEDILGSAPKISLIKLFIRNSERKYNLSEISRFLKGKPGQIKSALLGLKEAGFISAKIQKSVIFYGINREFPLHQELRALVLKANPASFETLKRSLRRIGNVKLAVVSGVFLGVDPARADLLVVGDHITQAGLKRITEHLEAEIGKEVVLATFSTKEFFYRMDMYDKFVRDILEYRHEKLINKLRI